MEAELGHSRVEVASAPSDLGHQLLDLMLQEQAGTGKDGGSSIGGLPRGRRSAPPGTPGSVSGSAPEGDQSVEPQGSPAQHKNLEVQGMGPDPSPAESPEGPAQALPEQYETEDSAVFRAKTPRTPQAAGSGGRHTPPVPLARSEPHDGNAVTESASVKAEASWQAFRKKEDAAASAGGAGLNSSVNSYLGMRPSSAQHALLARRRELLRRLHERAERQLGGCGDPPVGQVGLPKGGPEGGNSSGTKQDTQGPAAPEPGRLELGSSGHCPGVPVAEVKLQEGAEQGREEQQGKVAMQGLEQRQKRTLTDVARSRLEATASASVSASESAPCRLSPTAATESTDAAAGVLAAAKPVPPQGLASVPVTSEPCSPRLHGCASAPLPNPRSGAAPEKSSLNVVLASSTSSASQPQPQPQPQPRPQHLGPVSFPLRMRGTASHRGGDVSGDAHEARAVTWSGVLTSAELDGPGNELRAVPSLSRKRTLESALLSHLQENSQSHAIGAGTPSVRQSYTIGAGTPSARGVSVGRSEAQCLRAEESPAHGSSATSARRLFEAQGSPTPWAASELRRPGSVGVFAKLGQAGSGPLLAPSSHAPLEEAPASLCGGQIPALSLPGRQHGLRAPFLSQALGGGSALSGLDPESTGACQLRTKVRRSFELDAEIRRTAMDVQILKERLEVDRLRRMVSSTVVLPRSSGSSGGGNGALTGEASTAQPPSGVSWPFLRNSVQVSRDNVATTSTPALPHASLTNTHIEERAYFSGAQQLLDEGLDKSFHLLRKPPLPKVPLLGTQNLRLQESQSSFQASPSASTHLFSSSQVVPSDSVTMSSERRDEAVVRSRRFFGALKLSQGADPPSPALQQARADLQLAAGRREALEWLNDAGWHRQSPCGATPNRNPEDATFNKILASSFKGVPAVNRMAQGTVGSLPAEGSLGPAEGGLGLRREFGLRTQISSPDGESSLHAGTLQSGALQPLGSLLPFPCHQAKERDTSEHASCEQVHGRAASFSFSSHLASSSSQLTSSSSLLLASSSHVPPSSSHLLASSPSLASHLAASCSFLPPPSELGEGEFECDLTEPRLMQRLVLNGFPVLDPAWLQSQTARLPPRRARAGREPNAASAKEAPQLCGLDPEHILSATTGEAKAPESVVQLQNVEDRSPVDASQATFTAVDLLSGTPGVMNFNALDDNPIEF